MSVYRPTKTSTTYVYDFWWQGVRYKDSTFQTTKPAAALVEAKRKLELRERAGGLVAASPAATPSFSKWAEITRTYQARFITRPEILGRTLRMILAFWGAKPTTPIGPAAVARVERGTRPYHNLRLGDAIAEPIWLQRFEQWMVTRGVSGSTRNSYLSACSDLYTCAMQPEYKAQTAISSNPFAGIRRSPQRSRDVALTPDQILALVARAPRHIAHALCIAALVPKLRRASILALEWDGHFDTALTTIRMSEHKTAQTTGRAQVAPVSAQLRAILTDLRAAQDPPSRYVITWRDAPVKDIKKGLRAAVEAIGLRWGLKDGITFHTMRHSIATILANPHLVGALTERLRADVMGHLEIRTTQKYTHLNTAVQEGPHESLSAVLPGLRATLAQKRGALKHGGKVGGPPSVNRQKPQQKRVLPFAGSPTRKRA